MKGFTKIALAIALVAITVLSIVVASVAWFTSSPEVDANNVTMNSARTLTVTFSEDIDDANGNKGYKYNGQTGKGAPGSENAPYVYEAGSFIVSIHPSAVDKGGKVKVEFGNVEMRYGRRDSSYTTGTISDIPISTLFTIQANCYEESDTPNTSDPNDNFVRINGLYVKDDGTHSSLQHYKKTSYVIDADGFVKNSAGGNYILFPEGEYGFSFTFIFLSPTDYAKWLAAQYDQITGFPYSTERYIDATYTFDVTCSVEEEEVAV